MDVGVSGEVAADDHEVQLFLVGDVELGDRVAVGPGDDEAQFGGRVGFDDRGRQLQPITVLCDREPCRHR